MKYSLVSAICFFLMGILGCSTISTKEIKKQDLYLHCYACDSLGVEKNEFSRNEPITYGFVLKNISKHPIKYKKNDYSADSFDAASANIVDSPYIDIPVVENYFPSEMWHEYVLNPGEQLAQTQSYPSSWLKPGKCRTMFYFRFDFGASNSEIFGNYYYREVKYILKED